MQSVYRINAVSEKSAVFTNLEDYHSGERFMSRRPNHKKSGLRRKKRILIVEIVLLLLVSVVAFGSSWIKGKFDLIKHKDTDNSKIITAAEANSGLGAEDEKALEGKEMIALVGIDKRGENSGANSDSQMIALVDHDKKTIKLVSLYRDTYLNIGNNKYTKSNAAYNLGGPEQMLSMMNLNLDLNLTKYISVDFQAVADAIDALGGIDVELCPAEMKNINKINVESAHVTGYPYVKLKVPSKQEQGETEYKLTHLDPAQGLTYARIRYTAGNDFRRTARQRILIQKIMEKTKEGGIGTLNKVLDRTLGNVTTNIDNGKLISLGKALASYEIEDSVGFPFNHIEDDKEKHTGINCVIPVTLENNVQLLHKFLLNEDNYQVSKTVKEYSNYIINKTGLSNKDIPKRSEDGALPWDQKAKAANTTPSSNASGVQDKTSGQKTLTN
jgi:LCP family protein required for cell wall assembly